MTMFLKTSLEYPRSANFLRILRFPGLQVQNLTKIIYGVVGLVLAPVPKKAFSLTMIAGLHLRWQTEQCHGRCWTMQQTALQTCPGLARSHLQATNAASWPAILYEHKGFLRIVTQRLAHNSQPYGGRTGTRLSPGHVATRWHDGVRYAETMLSER